MYTKLVRRIVTTQIVGSHCGGSGDTVVTGHCY